jgi:hypothetical protein
VWCYAAANSFARCGEEGNLSLLNPTVKPVAMVADARLLGLRRYRARRLFSAAALR